MRVEDPGCEGGLHHVDQPQVGLQHAVHAPAEVTGMFHGLHSLAVS